MFFNIDIQFYAIFAHHHHIFFCLLALFSYFCRKIKNMKKIFISVAVALSVLGGSCSDSSKEEDNSTIDQQDTADEALWRVALKEKKATGDTADFVEIGNDIEAAIAFFNSRICPLSFDEGLVITEAKDEEGNLVCVIPVEESRDVSVKDIKMISSLMKDQLRGSFHDPDFLELVHVAAENGRGVRYRLEGDLSHETYNVNFSASEVRKIVDEMY